MKTTPDIDQPLAVAGKRRLFINRSFGLLWSGQTISLIGSHITGGGLQLAAVLVLGATPLQMSLLAALSFAPALLIGLLAGVWVDRLRRRPILIVADLVRAALLLSIPLAALLRLLRIEQLYIVTALVGVLSVFFEVAYRSFLPSLLPPEQLIEGNSKLSASESLAEVAGPTLAGWLVQAITAPIAILFDSLSFLLSALCIGLIRAPESVAPPTSQRSAFWHEMREGWHVLLDNPTLRALTACSASWNFCGGSFVALYTLFIIRVLGLAPAIYGLLGTMAGAGTLLGSLVVPGLSRRVGPTPLLIGALLLHGTMAALTPLIGSREPLVIASLLMAQLLGGVGYAFYFIREVSLRQEIIPDRLLGRVNACAYFLASSAALIGSLIAGVVSALIGIRLTLVLGSCGMAISSPWLLFSPLRKLPPFLK